MDITQDTRNRAWGMKVEETRRGERAGPGVRSGAARSLCAR